MFSPHSHPPCSATQAAEALLRKGNVFGSRLKGSSLRKLVRALLEVHSWVAALWIRAHFPVFRFLGISAKHNVTKPKFLNSTGLAEALNRRVYKIRMLLVGEFL